MKNMFRFSAILAIALLFSACKKEDESSGNTDGVIRPVVMVHGFLASGDTYELQGLRFASNGYSLDQLYTFEYNTLGGGDAATLLDKFIDEVRTKTGAQQVELVGHSRGSGLVYEYCGKVGRAAKVKHLVLLAGNKQERPGGPDGRVPTLNIWSTGDKVVTSGGAIPNAENLKLTGKDHYEVATSAETFTAMYKFFLGKDPATTNIIETANPVISGKALSFGENLPAAGGTLNVYEVDPATGFRLNASPDFSFIVDENNQWGPFTAKSGAHYEFTIQTGKAGDRLVHYYREPFKRDNKFVIIRSYAPEGGLAAAFLTALPSDNNQAVIAFFGSSQAAVADRDEFTVNGVNLSTNAFTSASNTTIALFMYDGNNNAITDAKPTPDFNAFPFLKGADFFFPTATPAFSSVTFKGRTLNIPHWKSKDEGVSVAVFD